MLGAWQIAGCPLDERSWTEWRQVRWYLVRTTDSSRNDSIAPNLLSKATVPTKSY